MKQISMLITFILFCSLAWGQLQTPLSIIGAAGGIGQTKINGNSTTVEWTLGETFIGGGSVNNQIITNGEQQGNFGNVGIENSIFNRVKLYPNPASNFVKIESMPVGNKIILLLDITGRTINTIYTADNYTTISTTNLPQGLYTLIIIKENSQSAFKILVINN